MPFLLLAAIAEVSTLVSTVAVGAEAAFLFIGERWWLQALADLVARHVTNGKYSFPRNVADATSLAGAAALSAIRSAADNTDLHAAIRHVVDGWEARLVLDLAERKGGVTIDIGSALSFIQAPIPDGVGLSEWLRDLAKATGLSSDQLLTLRRELYGR